MLFLWHKRVHLKMTKEELEAFKIAENGVLDRVYQMRKALDMIESWILYGRMEKGGGCKSGIISEECHSLDNDSGKSIDPRADMVTRHPITGEDLCE